MEMSNWDESVMNDVAPLNMEEEEKTDAPEEAEARIRVKQAVVQQGEVSKVSIDDLRPLAERNPIIITIIEHLSELKWRMEDLELAGTNVDSLKRTMDRIISLLLNTTSSGPVLPSTYTMARIQVGALGRQVLALDKTFVSELPDLPPYIPQSTAPRVTRKSSSKSKKMTMQCEDQDLPPTLTRMDEEEPIDVKPDLSLTIGAARPKRTRKPARSFSPAISPDSGLASGEETGELVDDKDEEWKAAEEPVKKRSRPSLGNSASKVAAGAYKEALSTRKSSTVAKPSAKSPKQKAIAAPVPIRPKPTATAAVVDKNILNVAEMGEEERKQSLVVINERINMETIRYALMRFMNPDGTYTLDYIPVIMDSIDKCVQALLSNRMVNYVIHKAAVDAGVDQLIQGLSLNTVSGLAGTHIASPLASLALPGRSANAFMQPPNSFMPTSNALGSTSDAQMSNTSTSSSAGSLYGNFPTPNFDMLSSATSILPGLGGFNNGFNRNF